MYCLRQSKPAQGAGAARRGAAHSTVPAAHSAVAAAPRRGVQLPSDRLRHGAASVQAQTSGSVTQVGRRRWCASAPPRATAVAVAVAAAASAALLNTLGGGLLSASSDTALSKTKGAMGYAALRAPLNLLLCDLFASHVNTVALWSRS